MNRNLGESDAKILVMFPAAAEFAACFSCFGWLSLIVSCPGPSSTLYVSLLHNKLSSILCSKEIFWNFKLFQNKNMEAVFSPAGDITPAKSCY